MSVGDTAEGSRAASAQRAAPGPAPPTRPSPDKDDRSHHQSYRSSISSHVHVEELVSDNTLLAMVPFLIVHVISDTW
jgi:hypothetical protein